MYLLKALFYNSLIVGDDVELVSLSTPEVVQSVFINIETDLLLLPVTELWFVVDHISMDGGGVLLIGLQFEGDAVSSLGGQDDHGRLWRTIDHKFMSDHVLSKFVVDQTFVCSSISLGHIVDL